MTTRRRVLQYGLAGVATVMPGLPRTGVTPADALWGPWCDLRPAPAGRAQAVTPSPSVAPFTLPLKLPPVAEPVSSDGGVDRYRITMRMADVEVLPGLTTSMWTYDGSFPGPTIRAQVGRPVVVEQVNELPEPTVVHLHGAVVAPEHDGHPGDTIAPGGSREYRYPNAQAPATLWYHDHAEHRTAEHVYRGLAGFYLLDDPAEAGLGLPRGDRDLPLMIADRAFEADGALRYNAAAHGGFFGDIVLVNGVPAPVAQVAATTYRLRVLNASNARTIELALDGATLVQVGSDGGLLPAPRRRDSIVLGSAERADLLLDLSATDVGRSVLLRDLRAGPTSPGLVRFDVVRPGPRAAEVPPSLREIAPLPAATTSRTVRLQFDRTSGRWLFDGRRYDGARIDALVRLGEVERWSLVNETGMAHPVHLHLVTFQVLSRGGVPEPADELAWKDTVLVPAGQTVEVAARFTGGLGTYVYHCHILEHEDHDMMAQLRVVDLPRLAGAGRCETAAAVSASAFAAGAAEVWLTSGDTFADALAAGPAAARAGAPLLLTTGDTLHPAAAAEIERLGARRVVVVGGTRAVPSTVEDGLRALGLDVARLSGTDRYATAGAVVEDAFRGTAARVFVATGEGFADALAGGAAAAAADAPVLLVARDSLPAATAEQLARLAPSEVIVLGGAGAVSDAVVEQLRSATGAQVTRLAGVSRHATAAAVSAAEFAAPPAGERGGAVWIADGDRFPDALAAVPAAAREGAPLLLVSAAAVPDATADELRRLAPRRIVVLGGRAAVPEAVEQELATFLP